IPKDREPTSLTLAECEGIMVNAPERGAKRGFRKGAGKSGSAAAAPKKAAAKKAPAKKAAAKKTAATKKAPAKKAASSKSGTRKTTAGSAGKDKSADGAPPF